MPNLTTIASYYAPVAKRPALVAALVGLGYPQRSLLSPLSCEVCDTTLSYAEALPCATEVATVQMGNGEYVTAAIQSPYTLKIQPIFHQTHRQRRHFQQLAHLVHTKYMAMMPMLA